MEAIGRRKFLKQAVLASMLPLYVMPAEKDMEKRIRDKIMESEKLSLESLLRIKSLPSLAGNDFNLSYGLFQDDSNSEIGTASANFSREKRVLDFGMDDFSLPADIFFWLSSLFSSKYEKMPELQKVRCSAKFNENLEWIAYGENIPKDGKTSLKTHYYESLNGKIVSAEKGIISNGSGFLPVHTPASALLEIAKGNFPKKFRILADEKISDVVPVYKEGNDFTEVTIDFPFSVIGNFRNVYVIICKGIPVAGYISQDDKEGKETSYIRGELQRINVNGKEILLE